MTAVPLPFPRPRQEETSVPQAVEHTHNYGQCLRQYCPKHQTWGMYRRCLFCGACQFC